MDIIDISRLTKDYGCGRGIFDVSLSVKEGECYGFLGPNGAGKTTTIRHLMGFSKPQSGRAQIMGKDTWKYATDLQGSVGYLPGEIALPSGMTGTKFLRQMKQMRGVKDERYLKMLLERFELDPNVDTKRMSLGVKRKLAVVTAFLHDPDILILDEPTSGLDPVMQKNFIEYILEEKKRGKTIFLSSHIFHEVDATCDRIAMIKDGKIVSEFLPEQLKADSERIYQIIFRKEEELKRFTSLTYEFGFVDVKRNRVKIHIEDAEIGRFISDLSEFDITDFREIPFTLEDYFMKFYKEDKKFQGVM